MLLCVMRQCYIICWKMHVAKYEGMLVALICFMFLYVKRTFKNKWCMDDPKIGLWICLLVFSSGSSVLSFHYRVVFLIASYFWGLRWVKWHRIACFLSFWSSRLLFMIPPLFPVCLVPLPELHDTLIKAVHHHTLGVLIWGILLWPGTWLVEK